MVWIIFWSLKINLVIKKRDEQLFFDIKTNDPDITSNFKSYVGFIAELLKNKYVDQAKEYKEFLNKNTNLSDNDNKILQNWTNSKNFKCLKHPEQC